MPSQRPSTSSPLDELWQAPALVSVMLAGEGLALVLALATDLQSDRTVYFGLASLMIQWIALLTIGGLYLLRSQLGGVRAQAVAWVALGLLLASTWLVGAGVWAVLHLSWPSTLDSAPMFLLRLTGIALTVGMLGLAAFNNHWRTRQLAIQAKQFELDALQSRIRPHFLFNTLNTGVALIHARPGEAERLLLDLADLFRAALSEQRDIPLAEELALTRRYLEIESLRFGERLRIRWDVPDRLPSVLVPALSIQPLVENAIRHGVEPSPTGADVEVRVRIEGEFLKVLVTNDLPRGGVRAIGGYQVGLSSSRERIRALSDGMGRLDTRTDGNQHVAEIWLPLPAGCWDAPPRPDINQAITR